jgi:hypothetical protein
MIRQHVLCHDLANDILLKGLLKDKGEIVDLMLNDMEVIRWLGDLDDAERRVVESMRAVSKSWKSNFVQPASLSLRVKAGREMGRRGKVFTYRLMWLGRIGEARYDGAMFQNANHRENYLQSVPRHMLPAMAAYDRVRMRLNLAAEVIKALRGPLRKLQDDIHELDRFMEEVFKSVKSNES